jgi:hypothetical protein
MFLDLKGVLEYIEDIRIGIVPPLKLVTCSYIFSPQLPLN